MRLVAEREPATTGLIAGISAYLLWGLAPIYFKLLGGIAPLEILAHRSIWSLLLAVSVMSLAGQLPEFLATLRDRRRMATLALSTALIATNWLIFIWAVNNDRIVEASLGYYINPLLNVVLGVLFLGERLRAVQWGAVALAACGILYELWQFGEPPLVSLCLAISFGLYGLVRKRAPVGSLPGLAVETLYLFPLGLAYLAWADSPTSDLTANSASINALLVLAGPVTLIPLLLFTVAARRLSLSTVGFLQYLGPSLMLALATLVFGEPFSAHKLVTFGFVWCALVIYSVDALLWHRRQRRMRALATG